MNGEKRPPPQYLLWELTLRCNCRCTHCAAAGGKPRKNELSTEEAIDLCAQIAALEVGSVCLMGGEALLRPDWDRVALRLRELGVAALGLVTNGIALNDDAWRRLEILGFCQVVISLDGTTPDVVDRRRGRTGALAAAQHAIEEMAARPMEHRTVVTSVDRTNIGQLEPVRDWLVDHAPGITWTINFASPAPGSRMARSDAIDAGDFLRLARFIAESRAALAGRIDVTGTHSLGHCSRRFPNLHNYQWQGCEAGLSTVGIRSDGDVTGCLVLGGDFIEGNVRKRPLSDLWHDPRGFSYNRAFSTQMLQGECRGCEHGEVCRGGCREAAVAYSGNPFEAPFCLHRMEQRGEVDL